MSMPFYVSPEQVMADKAEFARKGVARGKSSLVIECDVGILMMAENLSTLSKIGEIYDRVAFAGVGKFSEFDQLRKIGVRYADIKGYAYSRDDVRGRALANAYSQAVGDAFTQQLKPLEVEVVVAEVGDSTLAGHEKNAIYRIQYDATSIQGVAVYSVISFVAASITLVSMVVVMFRIDLELALVSMSVLPLLFGFSRAYAKRMKPRYKHVKDLESSALGVVQEILTGFRVVKAFGREQHEQQRAEQEPVDDERQHADPVEQPPI